MAADIIELGAHDNMSPIEALEYCLRKKEDFQDILIIGYDQEGDLVLHSSHMSREKANWLLDAAKHIVFSNPMLDLEEKSRA